MKKLSRSNLMFNRVSQVRKSFGLTQTELATMCGCTKNTISAIETGVFYPSLPLCFALCFCLSTSFDNLFIPSGGFEIDLWNRRTKVFPLDGSDCYITDFDAELPI